MGRVLALLAAALVVAVAPSAGSARPSGTQTRAPQLQVALLAQINSFRAAHGLARLRVSGGLTVAANAHSTQMARLGFLSHNSANGQSFSRRIARTYTQRGFRSWSVGENLVWGGPDIAAAPAVRACLRAHRTPSER